MTHKKLYIPIILGTNRMGRESEAVAKYVASYIEEARDDIDTDIVDVRQFAFPVDGYGTDIKDQFPEWRQTVERADGLIIVAPEYNHGYPGVLKSALDVLYEEYEHKVVGFVGVSSGPWGGVRGIENLLPVVRELKMVPIRTDLQFPKIKEGISEEAPSRIDVFLDELVFVGRSMRWGREYL